MIGRQKQNFGANAPRDSLLNRNVAQNPFGDPTSRKSPSPQKYQQNMPKIKAKNNILSKVGSSIGVQDELMNSTFQSRVDRNVMDTLPKDVANNPGPGAYDT